MADNILEDPHTSDVFYAECGSSRCFWNIHICLLNYIASHLWTS